MPDVGFRVKRRTSRSANAVYTHRLEIKIYSAVNISPAVFRFVTAGTLENGTARREFDGVCTALQLEDLPTVDPDADIFPSAYREDYADLLFPSRQTLEEAWTAIVEDLTALYNDVKSIETADEDADVEIGQGGNESSSSLAWE